MVGVLIAGSDPNACSEAAEELSDIAREHLEATGVETFVIDLADASASLSEAVGEAGGAPLHGPEFCPDASESCHHYRVADDDPESVRDALERIVELSRRPCDYEIPPPPEGEFLDPTRVNVQVDFVDGTTAVVPQIPDREACEAHEGWHYDNPQAPTSIVLCEATCERVTRADARLSAVYGCATLPL